MGIPVVSGNVSLYNESEGFGSIYPTPVIGMVGLLADYRKRLQAAFRAPGDFVVLVGETRRDLGGSEYLKVVHGQMGGRPPQFDLAREAASREFVLDAAGAGLLHSAHDVAEGGMLVALAECCLLSGMGVRCAGLRGRVSWPWRRPSSAKARRASWSAPVRGRCRSCRCWPGATASSWCCWGWSTGTA
jgi:phosphoribosylformylglycinamidine (FGAM) synthase-like enzyme